MDVGKQEVLDRNVLSLGEHVEIIRRHQDRIREALFDFVAAIRNAFDQLGPEVFELDLAKELKLSASTLNRWKSIGASPLIEKNVDSVPPVFSSLYEITLLEKLYVEEKGEVAGRAEVQKLINRGSISPTTEAKDIRFLVDNLKRERLDKKRKLKEQLLFDHEGSTGYEHSNTFGSLADAVNAGAKFRTIAMSLPKDLMTKWSDAGYLRSDIQQEFPISELRGRSEATSITCLLKVPNGRIDVAIKVLQAAGFSYRRTFFDRGDAAAAEVIVFGQRGTSSVNSDMESTDLVVQAKQLGTAPYLMLFGSCDEPDWTSIREPI
jgi:hypothetical protein